jgi:hypothetical protein
VSYYYVKNDKGIWLIQSGVVSCEVLNKANHK